MGYQISYKGLSRQAMYEKALKDAKEYLSAKQWKAALELGVHTKLSDARPRDKVRKMRFWLSFAGIQGPPATAFIKYAWGHLALRLN